MIACPICGGPVDACRGTAPAVRLTADQLLDIGEISEKEYRAMTERSDHSYPRQDVNEGQEHAYVGVAEDQKHDRPVGGWSNAGADDPAPSTLFTGDESPVGAPEAKPAKKGKSA